MKEYSVKCMGIDKRNKEINLSAKNILAQFVIGKNQHKGKRILRCFGK